MYYKMKKGGMILFMDEEIIEEHQWKNRNKKYLFELQKIIDLTDNIEDNEMKKIFINQIIRCDKTLTEIFEETLKRVLAESSKKSNNF